MSPFGMRLPWYVTALLLKRVHALMHSQRMASIAPIVIECIDYLAYGSFFTRAMFCPKIKLDVFFLFRQKSRR
jgi:hypothetical protein